MRGREGGRGLRARLQNMSAFCEGAVMDSVCCAVVCLSDESETVVPCHAALCLVNETQLL